MLNRREMLKHTALGAAGLSLTPFLQNMRAIASGNPAKLPKRFVFFLTGHGIGSQYLMPDDVYLPKAAESKKYDERRPDQHWDLYGDKVDNRSLAEIELPEWLASLNPIKDKVTCVLGLSGRMCSGFHSAGYGTLGAQRAQSKQMPKAETIDGALSKHLGGIFPHLGLRSGRVSALGPNVPLPAYGEPLEVYNNLFGVIAPDANAKAQQQVNSTLLDFMAADVKRFQRDLPTAEREKIEPYLLAYERMGQRHRTLLSMKDELRRLSPQAPPVIQKGSTTWEDAMEMHCELATNALIAGLCNVITINMDAGGIDEYVGGYSKRSGFETPTYWHGTGHSAEFGTRIGPFRYNVGQMAKMALALEAIPEADGTMLDNTLMLAVSMSGAVHHTDCTEFPMLLVGGGFGNLRTGRYLQYPHWGQSGNRTIGNMYTTLLHAAGAPRDGFNFLDISMDEKPQREPLAELLA